MGLRAPVESVQFEARGSYASDGRPTVTEGESAPHRVEHNTRGDAETSSLMCYVFVLGPSTRTFVVFGPGAVMGTIC